MKSTRNLNFRFSIVFVAVYALLLTSFPFAVSAQKTESITPGPGVSIREKVVFNDQSVAAFTDNTLIDSARGSGRGKKSPPSETPTNAQWDIAGKDGVKFYTNQDAWYRLSANQLQEYGFDISSDPGKWQLFADGVEVPMVVGTDMSIEFFGAAVDTPQTDSKVYFLTVGDTPGARIDSYWAGNTGQKPDVDSFNVKVERKDRQLYFTGILNGESENWFGSIVSSTAANLDLDLTNVRENGQPSLEVRVQGITTQSHLISVRVNDYDLGVISFAGKTLHQQSFAIPQSVIIEGTNQFTLQAIGAGSDFSVVDALSVTYARSYQAINDKLNFGVDRGQSVRVDGFSENGLRVYEISGGRAIGEIDVQPENNNGTFGFGIGSSNLDREFIAVTSSAALTPHRIEKNVPSAWNAASNAAAFLIVSPGAFAGQAQSLADRRISQGMNTKVVLTEDIGDEFGYGIITDVALYDFFAHARTYWREKPQAILLFGDSSFDMRNYSGGANRNLVPTKLIETFDMETSSDGWLVDFDKDGVEDVPIGRLPVADTLEAAQAVAKIVRYETQNLDEPRSALLAADYYFEILNGYLEALLPSTVSSQRVQRSSLGDAAMRSQILAGANANPTVVSYLGHGTTGGWTNASLFNLNDTPNMTNEKLSFYMLMTCLNGFAHNNTNSSMAESLVMAQNGAIAAWASSGSTYASGQVEMGQHVMGAVFARPNKILPIGQIVMEAKLYSNDWDARRTWQLFGDPTLKIK